MNPSTITYTNPNTGFTITAEIPSKIVEILKWLAANTFLSQYVAPVGAPQPPGTSPVANTPRYEHEANVIYRDVIELLVPVWTERWCAGQAASLVEQAQITVETKKSEARTAMGNIKIR